MSVDPAITVLSPAELVRQILVLAEVVVMPPEPGSVLPFEQTPADGSTLCFVSSVPDEVDQLVAIMNPAGRNFGRLQRGGRTLNHPGISIIIRALDERTGYALAQSVANALDAFVPFSTITVEGTQHYIQSVYRIGSITGLGEEPGRRRSVFSINARIAFSWQENVG